MKKIITISLLSLLLVSATPMSVFADNNAGIKPGSMFYFLDITLEKLDLLFTFNTEKKIEKLIDHGAERLYEAQKAVQQNNKKSFNKALKRYENTTISLDNKLEKIKQDNINLSEDVLLAIDRNKESVTTLLAETPVAIKGLIYQYIETNDNRDISEDIIDNILKQDQGLYNINDLEKKTEKLKVDIIKLEAEKSQLKKDNNEVVVPSQESITVTKGTSNMPKIEPTVKEPNLSQDIESTLRIMARQQCYSAYPSRAEIEENIKQVKENEKEKSKERKELLAEQAKKISEIKNSDDQMSNYREMLGMQEDYIDSQTEFQEELNKQELDSFDRNWDLLHGVTGITSLNQAREIMCESL